MKEVKVGTLMGVDKYGNHYYENTELQHGRHRWVEAAGLPWMADMEGSVVPADWHGWLHHMTDIAGDDWSVNEGEQMAERSDVPEMLNHNVGGVIADHTANLTQQRPRGFIDKSWEDGGKKPEYWVQPKHPLNGWKGAEDEQEKTPIDTGGFWVPDGYKEQDTEGLRPLNKV